MIDKGEVVETVAQAFYYAYISSTNKHAKDWDSLTRQTRRKYKCIAAHAIMTLEEINKKKTHGKK